MPDDTPTPDDDGAGTAGVEQIEIQDEVEQAFLDYAMSVIVARALPDVRDGLKPVHRRIIWGMYDQGVRPDRSHVKCARVVGDVMGKYHPHGDQAIYDALVRLGQDFSVRHPLIDPHGNFGSPSDEPAAMRYCVTGDTRVRLADGSTPRIAELAPETPESDLDIEAKVLGRRGDAVLATRAFHSGTHDTVAVHTEEGFGLTGTVNHPVLCLEPVAGVPMFQWRLLGDLEPGMRVAIDRTPGPAGAGTDDDHDYLLGVLLGAFVAEGFVSPGRAGCNNLDRAYFDEVVRAYDRLVGGPRYVSSRTLASGSLIWELDVQRLDHLQSSPLAELSGHLSADKRVPEAVWLGGPQVKQSFLQALFEGDGSHSFLARDAVQISYSSHSEGLVRDVQRLLLEFGVVGRIVGPSTRGEWRLVVSNRRDARRFERAVGFWGTKQVQLRSRLLPLPEHSRGRSADDVPFVAAYLRSEAQGEDRVWLERHLIDRVDRWEQDGDAVWSRVSAEARAVVEPILEAGYFYATVSSVVPAGRQPVFSLRVDSDDHAFLTDGFVSHNTECRLAPLAMRLVDGIDEDTVDFVDNFDGHEHEPTVLPARFPNLLVNGSQGIAVGMATNIPPHNLGEVIDATVHLIDNPDADNADLMQFVQGPDFPTGGLILGKAGIHDAYATGRGSVKVRAVAEIEETSKGSRIVVSQIPYQTSVETIETKAADAVEAKTIAGIREIRNESAKGQTRLVFELKKDAPALVILNNLYKHTPLQTNFAINMVALVDGVPRTLTLREAIHHYVEHQREVIRRRSEERLRKARDRAHIVEGLLKALDMIDRIIELIRGSDDRPAAKAGLMAEGFEFSEVQAEYILDMTLSRLTRLARTELVNELEKLQETIAELEAILASETKLRAVIKEEIQEIREKFATERRTQLTYDPGELNIEDLIDDEELVVTMSAKGYIKTVAADAFKTQGRGGRGIAGAKLRDEDYVTHLVHTTAHAYLLFFSNRGKVYRLKAHEIPMKDRTARGTAIPNLLALQPDEKIQAIIDTRDYESYKYLFFTTRNGQVKKTKFTEYDSSLRTGLIAINLKDGDELVDVQPTNGADDIFVITRNGQGIRFSEEDVRPMGRSAAGVRGMRLKAGDEVVAMAKAREDAALLIVTDLGYGKRTQLDRFNRQGRGGQGVRAVKITERKGAVVAAFMVGLDDELLIVATGGVLIRMAAREISSQGRDATGVRVMNLDEGQSVAAVAPVLQADPDD